MMTPQRLLEVLARLHQRAAMVEPHPTEIVVRERNAAYIAVALMNGERLLGERYRAGRLAREVHGPAQVIERDRDRVLVLRLTKESVCFLEPPCRLRRRALHVRHHPVRQEESRARQRIPREPGRSEHATHAIP